jgi:erythromycin esterase-like protein
MNSIKNFKHADSIINKIPKHTDILLLGESTHGTEEFYKTRSDITKQLITYEDFNIILFETDWFNLYNVNKYINNTSESNSAKEALSNIHSFPVWLWKNNIIIDLIEWLKIFNQKNSKKVYLLGLDCYLLKESLDWLYTFLKLIDIELYNIVQSNLLFMKKYKTINEFIKVSVNNQKMDTFVQDYFQQLLIKIQTNSDKYIKKCKMRNIDTIAVISAEICCDVMINSYEYFKKQYLEPPGSNASWNTRDQHMLMTTMKLKDKIPNAKIIIWAHNSHIGDATSTEQGGTDFSNNNSWNLGQMCRAMFENTFIIGFGTYDGSLLASQKWGEKHNIYILNVPIKDSIEENIYNFCKSRNINNCFIDLKECKNISPFNTKKKQRMVGVIYNSNNELQSHYITSTLSEQYDLYIFITHTSHLIEPSQKKSFTDSF